MTPFDTSLLLILNLVALLWNGAAGDPPTPALKAELAALRIEKNAEWQRWRGAAAPKGGQLLGLAPAPEGLRVAGPAGAVPSPARMLWLRLQLRLYRLYPSRWVPLFLRAGSWKLEMDGTRQLIRELRGVPAVPARKRDT